MVVVVVVVVDLPLLRVAVEGSDNPISLEKPFLYIYVGNNGEANQSK